MDEFEGDKSDRVASDEISEVKKKEKEEKENLKLHLKKMNNLINIFTKKENIEILEVLLINLKWLGK